MRGRQRTGLRALLMALGGYVWKNRHELRRRIETTRTERKLGRADRFQPDRDPRNEPIEADFRKIS